MCGIIHRTIFARHLGGSKPAGKSIGRVQSGGSASRAVILPALLFRLSGLGTPSRPAEAK